MDQKILIKCSKYIFFLIILLNIAVSDGQSQTETEKPVTCEYLKAVLDDAAYTSANSTVPSVSGLRPYTIFVISPGNKKNSNIKTARRLGKALDSLFTTGIYKSLRYKIIESRQKKGFGTIEIYFLNKSKEFNFDNNVFYCP